MLKSTREVHVKKQRPREVKTPKTDTVQFWISWFKMEKEDGNTMLFSWLPGSVTEVELGYIREAAAAIGATVDERKNEVFLCQ